MGICMWDMVCLSILEPTNGWPLTIPNDSPEMGLIPKFEVHGIGFATALVDAACVLSKLLISCIEALWYLLTPW